MKVTVIGKKKTVIEYEDPVFLSIVVRDVGEDEDMGFFCGGAGVCGKCKIYAEGKLSPVTETEKSHLTEDEIKSGVRLACLTNAVGDAVVKVIPKPYTGLRVEGAQDAENGQFENLTGVAVDIGTTTVAAEFFYHGKCLSILKGLNPQRIYGADVISRISGAEADGGKEMSRLINEEIDGFVDGVVKQYGITEEVPKVVVGNTTMMHFYENIDAAPIGKAPFTPNSYFGYEKGNTYLPRCISGYVGADAVSAVLASEMTEKGRENTLLCDIGTNGEILFWDGEKLHACSTAAGPALEGAGIAYGMMACEGAIDKAEVVDGELKIHVIGHGDGGDHIANAVGICGGGLIDLIASLLKLGIIDETGYMEENYQIGNIYLAPEDVRAFQLAKSSIRSGIDMMTKNRAISNVYISGGFGSGISVESAIAVGLFPESFRGKTEFIGNGALTGARMMLASPENRKRSEELALFAEYTELSLSTEFFDHYIENMNFPEV